MLERTTNTFLKLNRFQHLSLQDFDQTIIRPSASSQNSNGFSTWSAGDCNREISGEPCYSGWGATSLLDGFWTSTFGCWLSVHQQSLCIEVLICWSEWFLWQKTISWRVGYCTGKVRSIATCPVLLRCYQRWVLGGTTRRLNMLAIRTDVALVQVKVARPDSHLGGLDLLSWLSCFLYET